MKFQTWMKKNLLLSFFFVPMLLYSQNNSFSKGYLVRAIIVNGDTIPVVHLDDTKIIGKRIFESRRQEEKYNKLKRDVKKVYPYAIIAGAKLKEYNLKLATIPFEAQRRIYMKKAETELKIQFEEDLKRLTMKQGRILIKLIDRETGQTSYDLVKDLRGSFSAFMWQSLARIFGSNLKSEYDAKGEDKEIERIILMIECGEI